VEKVVLGMEIVQMMMVELTQELLDQAAELI
jgi:hypothetical protein